MLQVGNPLRRAREAHYAWWLAALCFIVIMVGNVPLFQGIPAWFVVLKHRFGWTAAQMSWAFSVTRAEGAFVGPLAGFLTDRFGSRRMVRAGLPIQGVGFLLFSQVDELWQLYGAFIVMSLGAGIGVWLPMMAALNNWFSRGRAIAMGVPMAGMLYGGVILIPLLAWAIDPEDFGPDRWRWAAAVIGVFLIIIAYPISSLVRDRPEAYGMRPYGDAPPDAPTSLAEGKAEPVPASRVGYQWRDAMRTREFWVIAWGHALISAMYSAVIVHLGLILDDYGLSLQTVGWVVAAIGLVGGTFTVVGGWAGSRVPIRFAIFAFSVIQSLAILLLVFADSAPRAFLFAAILGVGFGGRVPLTIAIRGVYFGRREFARITALSLIPLDFLHFGTPLFAGYMADYRGSYDMALVILMVAGIVGSLLFLLLPAPETFLSAPSAALTGTQRPARV